MAAAAKKRSKRIDGTPAPEVGALGARAMLVAFTCHWWDGVKVDDGITDEVNKKYTSDGQYAKRLVPLPDLLAMRSARIVTQQIHKRYTLAWSDDGWRIIASGTFETYDRELRAAIAKAEAEMDKFAKTVYPTVLKEKEKTDKSFKSELYPTPGEIRNKYGFRRRFRPVPQGQDLRVNLSDEALAAVRTSIDSEQQERIQTALTDVAERVKETVGKMVERLREYKPPKKNVKAENSFQDSLVENVRDLAALLPKINVIGSAKIDQMAADLTKLLTDVTPDHLRSDDKARLSTADAAEKILRAVSDFI